MPESTYSSKPDRAICERARKVTFRSDSPNEEAYGYVEVMSGAGNVMSVHIERSHLKKYGGKKWHTESVYATLTVEAWQHLLTAVLPDVVGAEV